MSLVAHSKHISPVGANRGRQQSRRNAKSHKQFRRSFLEQLEPRQVMAAIIDTVPGGVIPGGGTFFDQGLDYYDGATKVVPSDPRVEAWQTAEFTNDTFLIRFQNWVDRPEAESTIATHAPGSTIRQWDEELRSAWVSLAEGSTRQDVLNVSHQFLSLSNTLYAEPNFIYESRRIPNDPNFVQQWALNNTGQLIPDSSYPAVVAPYTGLADADIDAPEAWDLTTGSPNTVIAILDTGYNFFEPSIQANLWVNPGETYNGIDDDGNGVIDDYHGYDAAMNDGDPQDDVQDGHGMQVASMAAMPTDDATGIAGVSWHSKLMHVKLVDDGGAFTTGGIVGGMNYVTKMKKVYGINIVAANLSFGGPTFSFSQSDALRLMGAADVLICAAVANQGYNHDIYFDSPTQYKVDQIISVTATNAFDQLNFPGALPGALPEFGYGAVNVDIAAPGIEVMASGFRYGTAAFNSTLYVNTGTSLATPIVAGSAALVKSLAPYLTAREVKALLMNNVDKTPYLNNLVVADGRLNVFSALNAIPKTTITGTVFQDANADRVQGVGETGLAGWTVYLDLDNDGIHDTNEPSTVSAVGTGAYSLDAWVDTGTYRVRQVLQPLYTQTTPSINGGSFVLNVTARGQDFSGRNFGNRQVPGSISGSKFLDLDADGVRDLDEPGLEGIMFYVDLNNNRRINAGEPGAYTDVNGNFVIPNMQPGTYFVREVLAGGYLPTVPNTLDVNNLPDPVLTAVVTSNTTTTPLVFGNQTARDYGDLPESLPGIPNAYNTTIARGGPSHGILPGFMLGTRLDFEANGRPNAAATGDDTFPTAGPDDEDGLGPITLVEGLTTGFITFTVTNINQAAGLVQAWIDFNGNGSFADDGDQILRNYSPVNGLNENVPFTIPGGVSPGVTYARLRYSHESNLGPDGAARAGEVEDYQLTIFSNLPIARDDFFPDWLFNTASPDYPNDLLIKQESANNRLDVLRNDPLPLSNQLRIYAGDFPFTQDGSTVTLGTDANGKDILLFTPRGGTSPFTGDFDFEYRVYDPTKFNPAAPDLSLLSATADVFVKVTANDPRLVDNTYTMVRGSSLTEDVTLNDVATSPIRLASFTPAMSGPNTVLVGATITQNGNNLTFTPPADFTGTVQFTYRVTDDDVTTDNSKSAIVTVQVTEPPPLPAPPPIDLTKYQAVLSLRVVDMRGVAQGSPGFFVNVGETFFVDVMSEDLRPNSTDPTLDRGVEAAFIDLLYDRELVAVNFAELDTSKPGLEPNINFAGLNPGDPELYNLDQNGIVNAPQGVINELGAAHNSLATGRPVGPGVKHVVRVTFEALDAGTFTFVADPAEDASNRSQILLASAIIPGSNPPVPSPTPVTPTDYQVFLMPLTQSLTIDDPFGAAPEFVNTNLELDVNFDAQVDALDALVLVNDLNTSGARSLSSYHMAVAGELPPAYFIDVNNDGMMTAFDALRVINWLNENPTGSSAPEDTSGGEFVPLAFSAGEFVEETAAEESSTRSVVTPVLGSTTSSTSNQAVAGPRRLQQASNNQDDSGLLYLTALDQLMAAHSNSEVSDSDAASDVPLNDWLDLDSQLSSARSKRSGLRSR